MKRSHITQNSRFDFYPKHEFGKELKFIPDGLNKNPDLIGWVQRDLSNICKNNARQNYSV